MGRYAIYYLDLDLGLWILVYTCREETTGHYLATSTFPVTHAVTSIDASAIGIPRSCDTDALVMAG